MRFVLFEILWLMVVIIVVHCFIRGKYNGIAYVVIVIVDQCAISQLIRVYPSFIVWRLYFAFHLLLCVIV